MANGTTAAAPAARGTQRESFSVLVTPVDEKRFESEIRRMDAAVSEEKKSREKFETRIEKAVNDLRGDMNARFEKIEKSIDTRFDKVDTRFDKMDVRMARLDDRLWWIFGAIVFSIVLPVVMKYL
jgi:hypothetical protein